MRSVAVTVYQWLAWFILAGLVAQFFFAGLGVFGGTSWELHVAWGHSFEFFYLLLLVLSLAGRMGRRLILFSLLLFALIWVQALLPSLRSSVPVLAAIHPVNALVLLYVTHLSATTARVFRHRLAAAGVDVQGAGVSAPDTRMA